MRRAGFFYPTFLGITKRPFPVVPLPMPIEKGAN